MDANGNTVSVKDDTETITYEYYANNALKNTKYGSHTIATGIDGWGRKTSLLDPSVSTKPYTYSYNNFGEMTAETTPTGTNLYEYLPTGRLKTKKSMGTNTNATLTYEYNAKGFLIKQTGVNNNKNYIQDFVYNNFYQLITQTETTPSLVTVNSFTYDAQGRKLRETTNARLVANASVNNGSPTVEYGYNAYNGMLDQIKDTTGKILWKLNNANEQLQATNIYLGNGLTTINTYDNAYYITSVQTKNATSTPLDLTYGFDMKTGLLNARTNKSFGYAEGFQYDKLERLTNWSSYTQNDNTSHKTDFNAYDNFSRITQNNQLGEYNYDATSRYKKSQIKLSANGNTYYKARQKQNVSYDINQNSLKITETGKTTLDFVYDAEGSRVETIFTKDKTINKMVFYTSDNTVEVEITAPIGNQPAKYNFMTYLAGDPYDAPMVYRKNYTNTGVTPNTEGVYYLHRDYLGSILAISNSAGVTVERRHFDAWGNLAKLQVNGVTATDINLMLTQRGYTGHEHFYEQDIIHMNGRIYDPKLRMFLSPDINLLDPSDSKHYNRYAYALNNPLMYSDPSGNEITLAALGTAALVGALIGGISYSAIAAYYGNFSWNNLAKSVVVSAVTSVAFQFGVAALKDVLFPALANTGGGYLSTGGGDALIKMPNFLCEPCAKQAKNLKTLIWSGRIASGIGGGAATALTQSSGVNVPPRGDLPWYKSYFDYNGDNRISNMEVGMGALDVAVMTFDIVTVPSGEGLLNHEALRLASKEGGLNLFKWGTKQTGKSKGWKVGDYMLNLANKGTPKLNWKANYGALRREMKLGKPIFDTYVKSNGSLRPTSGFLKAERYILQSRGWKFDKSLRAWLPPK